MTDFHFRILLGSLLLFIVGACGQSPSNSQVPTVSQMANTEVKIIETPSLPTIENTLAPSTGTPIPAAIVPIPVTPATLTPYEYSNLYLYPQSTLDPSLDKITAVWVIPLNTGVIFGDSAIIKISFQQMFWEQGVLYWTPLSPWTNRSDIAPVTEMQMCIAADSSCQLAGNWEPFVKEKAFKVQVDWIGDRFYWLTVQFRDSQGDIIPSILTLVANSVKDPVGEASFSVWIGGYYDASIPLTALPFRFRAQAAITATELARIAPTETMYAKTREANHNAYATSFAGNQTAIAATEAALAKSSNSVTGTVKFSQDVDFGREKHCCYGAHPGETISFPVYFAAASPFAEIKEVRLATGYPGPPKDIESALWEPFASEKTFSLNVSANWINFYIRVQYRDALGNVSTVYENYIGIEGW